MISLVMTLMNEMESLPALWDSILNQERMPDEVVIVDGGSTDGTVEFLRRARHRFPVKTEIAPGNISSGRNRAVSLSRGDVIAVTDGGCILDSSWLRLLVDSIESGADVACGGYFPVSDSFKQDVIACVTMKAPFQIRQKSFMPSHRSVAYRRETFERAGGYPEWLDYGEDMFFNHEARRKGAVFKHVPDGIAYWKVRDDLKSLIKQFERYAYGDGVAQMYMERHAVRFLAYLAAILISIKGSRSAKAAITALAASYTASRIVRIPVFMNDRSFSEKLAAAAIIPFCMGLTDAARMCGFIRGTAYRSNRLAKTDGRGEGLA